MTVMLGDGSGSFTSGVSRFTVDLDPLSMAVADFNGDGTADIVTANFVGNDATVLLGGKAPTTSILSATSLTASFGQSLPLTLTMSDVGPGISEPTGTVTFSEGTNALGVASQTSSPFTFGTSSHLGVGNHTFTATYGGDVRSLGSTSNSLTIRVNAVPASCDLMQTGSVNVADVQAIIDQALGVAPPANDLNEDGVVNVLDVQIEINAALGLGCSAG